MCIFIRITHMALTIYQVNSENSVTSLMDPRSRLPKRPITSWRRINGLIVHNIFDVCWSQSASKYGIRYIVIDIHLFLAVRYANNEQVGRAARENCKLRFNNFVHWKFGGWLCCRMSCVSTYFCRHQTNPMPGPLSLFFLWNPTDDRKFVRNMNQFPVLYVHITRVDWESMH